jgi:hypothetical protein
LFSTSNLFRGTKGSLGTLSRYFFTHTPKKHGTSRAQGGYGSERQTIHTIIKKIFLEMKSIQSISLGITHGEITVRAIRERFHWKPNPSTPRSRKKSFSGEKDPLRFFSRP